MRLEHGHNILTRKGLEGFLKTTRKQNPLWRFRADYQGDIPIRLWVSWRNPGDTDEDLSYTLLGWVEFAVCTRGQESYCLWHDTIPLGHKGWDSNLTMALYHLCHVKAKELEAARQAVSQ